MKRRIRIVKRNEVCIYGDEYIVDEASPQMYYYSDSTAQDFEQLRIALIKFDLTIKDFERWNVEKL